MTESEIQLSINGTTSGPHTKADILDWLRSGRIPQHAQCWWPGMMTWVPVTAAFPNVRQPRNVGRVYQSGRSPYGRLDLGLGRAGYAAALVLLIAVTVLVLIVCSGLIVSTETGKSIVPLGSKAGPVMLIIMLLLIMAGLVWAAVKRVRNIGWSGWFAMLLFVPLVGTLFQFGLFILPPGYAMTRRLDNTSWLALTLLVLAIGGIILLAIQWHVFLHQLNLPSLTAPTSLRQ